MADPSPASLSVSGAAPAPAKDTSTLSQTGLTPAAGAGTELAIRVRIELDTEDGLRKVFFGLEEDTRGTDTIWTIHFELQERKTTGDEFTNVVTLDVTVDDEALHPAAQAAANQRGLTPPQSAHALGPAADDAKGSTTGDIDPDDAKDTVKNTLAQ